MKTVLMLLVVVVMWVSTVLALQPVPLIVNDEADLGGQVRYSAFKKITFWVSSATDLDGTVSGPSEEIYGFLDRIVISVTASSASNDATDSFEVTLKDENGVAILQGTASGSGVLDSASSPYSYALTESGIRGASQPSVAVGGDLVFSIASGEDLVSASIIVYYRSFWK